MLKKRKKIELLAPAGNLSKLKYAIRYGADAVYCGVPDFSLRVRINQFTKDDLVEAIDFVHKNGKKIYVTLNIYAHNRHLEKIKEHLGFLKKFKIDGIIVSDPGVVSLVKKYFPRVEIHLSTQANATNIEAVKFWKKQGVSRIILARELSLDEIKEISEKVRGIELETFIHGAMCMSYSGRCILSKWMTDRSANLGDCSQPCRWNYEIKNKISNIKNEEVYDMSVIDDQKRFEMDVEEDEHGTYFFNSYDMNLIEYVDRLMNCGASSLKIEGRAKSAYYVAIVVRAYRKVMDAIINKVSKKELARIIGEQKRELDTLVNRGYSTGFFFGHEPEHNFKGENKKSTYQFVGEVEGEDEKYNIIRAHNNISISDNLEAITPQENIKLKIIEILDHNQKEVQAANGGHEKRYYFKFNKILPEGSLLRKFKSNKC